MSALILLVKRTVCLQNKMVCLGADFPFHRKYSGNPGSRCPDQPHRLGTIFPRTNGIKNLKMGKLNISLIAYPAEDKAVIEASSDFTLCLKGREINCKQGENVISL